MYSIFNSYSIIVAFFAQMVLPVIVTDGRCVYTYLDINVRITVANVCTFIHDITAGITAACLRMHKL